MEASLPDGIPPSARHASDGIPRFVPLLILGAIAAFGLSGYGGGGGGKTLSIENAEVRVSVTSPSVVRSGEFFERIVDVQAIQAIGELSVSIDRVLLQDITINSAIPEGGEESFEDGQYRLTIGPLDAGKVAHLQMELQANSDAAGRQQGDIVFHDGASEIGRLPLSTTILP